MKRNAEYKLAAIAVVILAVAGVLLWRATSADQAMPNPLQGRQLYVDPERTVARQASELRTEGRGQDAELLDRIATQPGTMWLTGPQEGDPRGDEDVADVRRISQAAAREGSVAVYQLYAIPNRDACAAYSKAGFADKESYLDWINRIADALQGDAVFSVEADAVAHGVGDGSCLNDQQRRERSETLTQALQRLDGAPHVVASYLDAGHSEWLPDTAELADALRDAGIAHARGAAINVSAYVATDQLTGWAERLRKELGDGAGIVIDTSRNGQGVPSADKTGEDRWCNPPGRGLGAKPTTQTGIPGIDAYLYVKNAGESDGTCNGGPEAGSFDQALALGLARRAKQQ